MKRMIVLLPCLEEAGGISVLKTLFCVLKDMKVQIELYSMLEGPMRQTFEKMSIPVKIQENMLSEEFIEKLHEADEVFVNTLQMISVIKKLNNGEKKVRWWIHEPPAYFRVCSDMIPEDFFSKLGENVIVYAAGNLVHDYIWEQYRYDSIVLNFGVKEVVKQQQMQKKRRKKKFLLPSFYFDYLKGQDLLLKAILNLPQEYLNQAEFYFLGIVEEDMVGLYQIIKKLEFSYGNVHYLPAMEHEELLNLMCEMDCLVAPSREDATNACIVEGLMLSKLCICSDMTGVSRYLEDGVSAYVFPAGEIEELTKRIIMTIDAGEECKTISECGNQVFKKIFSESVFRKNVIRLFDCKR